MRNMRSVQILVAIACVAFVACSGRTTPPATHPAVADASSHGDVLFLETDHGPATASVTTGAVVVADPAAIPAPDGSRLYDATVVDGATAIRVRDSATGDVLGTRSIAGALAVRLASDSGRSIALMAPLPAGVDTWTPTPRSETSIVVADPLGTGALRRYRLRGNFEPEAFAVDDTRLFLIQYLPAEAPVAYRVRVLDLSTGHVSPVLGRYKTPPQRMPGIRLRQVYAPDGSELYTLYTNRPGGYAAGYGYGGGGSGWGAGTKPVTFVHVLNLRDGWAYCVGLPKSMWDEPASAQALAASPDGRTLFIVDSVRGIVADLDTNRLTVRRSVDVDLGAAVGLRTSAQVSADGATLFVGSFGAGKGSVTAIDTASMSVLDRWSMPGGVSGLGLSDDGRSLYVALGNRVLVVNPQTGAQLSAVSFAGLGSILRLGTPGV